MKEVYSSQPDKHVRHLLIVKDDAGVRPIALETSSYFIGRDPKNSIVLSCKSVSRQHAILLRISGADPSEFSYVLIDGNLQGQRSKNGSQVNKQDFVSTRLQAGDSIQFGNKVEAKYLTLNMTASEFEDYCQEGDFDDHFTEGIRVSNPKETMVINCKQTPAEQDLFLIHRATFPEIFPSPMFEITIQGQLTYLNPAAHESFPDLRIMGLEHPALDGLAHHITSSNKKVLSREVEIKGRWYEQSIHYIKENGIVRCCLLDVTQRKDAEEALRRRDQLSKSVAEVTTHLLTGLHQDSVIDVALEMFGNSIGVDRICISQNHQSLLGDDLLTTLQYEWVKPDQVASILQQPHRLNQRYSSSYLQRWYTILAEDGMICHLRKDMPDEEKNILFRDSILSILVVPINVNNSFWGFLELDYCLEEYEWTDHDVANVRALAASIGAAIQRQQQEQVIQHQAFHDALTGLPNRLLFHEALENSLTLAEEHNYRVAVMFLDLDKFKVINDTLGHSVGDGLLQEVSERLKRCIRSTDMVARWGGDEFIILMPNISRLDDAVATAQRILNSFRKGCHVEDHDLMINTSIGIATYPNDALEAEVLVRNADIALYQSKDRGRGTYQMYDSGIDSEAPYIFSLRERLSHGIAENDFLLYYQPQISLETRSIVGMETLVRWNHPQFGVVYPNQFLPLVGELGLMQDLSDWVMEMSVQQCLTWHRMGFDRIKVSMNLSDPQFHHPGLVNQVKQVLERFSCSPEFFQMEISEEIAFKNIKASQAILQSLGQLGVSIVIDDFGLGSSSLQELTQLPIHEVKFHRQLVKNVHVDRKSAAIIHGLISMANYLDIQVSAVGIDHAEKLSLLQSLDCNLIQGYLIAPPLTVEAATSKLEGELHLPTGYCLIHS